MTSVPYFIFWFFFVEAAAADEFPQDGIERNFVIYIYDIEVIQELYDPAGNGILRIIRGDLIQQFVGKGLKYRDLVSQGGIEYYISFFLIREDVFIFPVSY